MFLDGATFEKMNSQSVHTEIGTTAVRAVSARHLVTLKIHDLKRLQEERMVKDYGNIIFLLKSRKAIFSTEELKALCLKYASEKLYTKIQNDLVDLIR